MKNKKLYVIIIIVAGLGFILKIKWAQLIAMPFFVIILFELALYMWKYKYIVHSINGQEVRLTSESAPIQFWVIYLMVLIMLLFSVVFALKQWSFF